MTKSKTPIFILPLFLLIAGCATTSKDKEFQDNKAIVDSAIREGMPKPVINGTTAIISNTVRRNR